MLPPFALPPPDFPLPAYVRQAESGLLLPDRRLRRAVLPGLVAVPGLMGASAPPVALSFLDTFEDDGWGDDVVFLTNRTFGAAADDRYIIVCAATTGTSNSPTRLTSMAIGGVSATVLAGTQRVSLAVDFAIAPVPLGETGSISASFTANIGYLGISWWRATGIKSATPTDSDVGSADINENVALSLDVKAGGAVVAGSFIRHSSFEARHTAASNTFKSAQALNLTHNDGTGSVWSGGVTQHHNTLIDGTSTNHGTVAAAFAFR